MQGIFVVAEMAMALVLLAGAGLMIRSLTQLWNVDPGFNPHDVLTVGLSLPPSMMTASPDAIRTAFRQFDDKMKSIPGVQAVSQNWGSLPMGYDDEITFWLDGQPKPSSQNDMNWGIDYIVEPGYQKAMGIPLLRGRFFTDQDNEHSPRVVVVDDVFARKYFPNQDPIDKRIQSENFEPAQIVGRGWPRKAVGPRCRRYAKAPRAVLYPVHADVRLLHRHAAFGVGRDRAFGKRPGWTACLDSSSGPTDQQ